MEMNGLGWKRVSERRSARATPDALRLQTLVEGLDNRIGESGSSKQISPEREQTRGRRVLAVGSGKGGVGKTLVSSSLALGLAEHLDHRVLAIDVDLGVPIYTPGWASRDLPSRSTDSSWIRFR